MDKLQRVLNAAARIVTGTRKFDRDLGQLLRDELHGLDVPDRVFFKLAVIVHRCLNGRAPLYLSDYCVPAAGADTRQQLRVAECQQCMVDIQSATAEIRRRKKKIDTRRNHRANLAALLHTAAKFSTLNDYKKVANCK